MGKIKDGLGSLIGNAGEHYVMAELLKRCVIAALAPRNALAFDILATNPEKTIRIRVKTKSEEISDWQWSIKKDGTIFRYLQEEGDFTIMVDLAEDVKNMRYFIIPTKDLNSWLISDFQEWLETPGKNNKQRSKDNPKRNLSYQKWKNKLESYESNWNILWK